MEKCRLCLSESGTLTHVSEVREGLPLSVIAMIICPIKIESNDNLPKKICADCVEVLLTAYHLRDTSNQNDRFLRENVYVEPLVKEERLEEENPIFFEPMAEDTRSFDGIFEPTKHYQNLSEPSAKGYTVDCFKNDNKSFVWKYFGALCDRKGNAIDSEFFYCVFCVQEDKLMKYSKQNATTCYLRHLQRLHNISEPPKKSKFGDKKAFSLVIFICDLCGEKLSTKPSLKRHMQRKHEGGQQIGDNFIIPSRNLYSDSDYIVDCYKSRKSAATSMVWNFFGKLLDLERVEVESAQGYHFCRLCNDVNILSKFSVKNATTGLMNHLVSKHGISSEMKTDDLDTIVKQEPNPEFVGYSVNCYKAAVNKSFCWNYFGMLVDADNTPVESESEFIYCKICVMKGRTDKKFKGTCATTNLLFHLKANHGISSDKSENGENLIVKNHSKRDDEREKTCSICCESFETRKAYFNHLRSVHNTTEAYDYICHVCSKSFTKNYILAKHMKIHSGIDYFCSLCPASFTYPEGLKRHEKIHDPSHLSKYQCDQCPNSYAERKSLKLHIMTVHMNKAKARNHRCEVCDMTFVTSNNLKRHVMKHTGEKPHECQYCDASYTQKGDLIKHLQRAHNTMYNCAHSGCSASFRLLVELREHYSVHFKPTEKMEGIEETPENE